MGMDAPGARKRLITGLFVVLSLVGLGLLAATWFSHANQAIPGYSASVSLTGEVTSQGGTSTSFNLPLGLLSDYYEHGIEHAPPRDPRGVMQRREDFYRAPIPPAGLLRARLGSSANDAFLHSLVDQWEADWLAGHVSSGPLIHQLQGAAERSSLNALVLIEAGKGFQFLEGDQLAAAFFHAALAKAERQFAQTPPGDPAALPFLQELDQTKALWHLKDYPALETRFFLARRLSAPLSIEARRSGYLLADTLFYQDHFDEAADLIEAVQAEHQRVGDLGLLEKSDLYEMNYERGYLLFAAGRFASAIPLLKLVVGGGEHDQVAQEVLFQALLQNGRFQDARRSLADLENRFKIPESARAALAKQLEESIEQDRWRQQTLVSAN